MWLQAYPHYHRAQYAAASNYLTDAWRIFEQLESGDRELKANLINDLTVTSGELGTLFSVPEPTEALSIRQELFGELHPDVANSLNTLSHWYGGQGDLETALDYSLRALEIRWKLFSDPHPEIAQSLNSTGMWYGQQGKLDRALRYCNDALEMMRDLFGDHHPNVARSFSNVGLLYRDQQGRG